MAKIKLTPGRKLLALLGIGAAILLISTICHLSPAATATATAGDVMIIPIDGNIEPGKAAFVRRALSEAEKKNSKAVILEIGTFGGRVDSATEIRDLILESKVESIAYIKTRAWSAGALISIACDRIYMKPGSTIGSAEPRPSDEKIISAVRSEFESTAEKTGRDPVIAAAMVDSDVEIPGLVEKGKLLNLTAVKAKEIGFIEGMLESREELLSALDLKDRQINEMLQSPAEKLAGFVTDPVVSSILLILGILGIIFEIFTPGFGAGGIVGLLFLSLFFGGRMVAGLAGWEIILLFIVGVALLIAEVFLIPGFGIAGIAGLGSMILSIFLSFDNPSEAAAVLFISIIFIVIGIVLIIRFFSGTRSWGRLMLLEVQKKDDGYSASYGKSDILGRCGVALTDLRPSGIVLIGDERIDVVSEGGYIVAGAEVCVVKVEGNRVIVRPVDERQ